MHRGFAKLYRKFLEWEWYDDTNVKVLFIHLLLKTNHKDKKYRGELIEKGSFVTSFDSLSKELSLSVKQIRLAMNKLEKSGHVTRKGTRKGQVVYLANFDTYNGDEKEKGKQEGIERASKGQEEGIERASTKNVKNYKNEKNVKIYSEQIINLSQALLKTIRVTSPKQKDSTKKWLADIDKLVRIDGASESDIQQVLKWIPSDRIWSVNILSGNKLRKHYDQLLAKSSRAASGAVKTSDGYAHPPKNETYSEAHFRRNEQILKDSWDDKSDPFWNNDESDNENENKNEQTTIDI